MTSKKKILTISAIGIFVIIVGTAANAWYTTSQKKNDTPSATTTPEKKKLPVLEIPLKNGKPAKTVSTYLVRRNAEVEFHITSDVFGKVGAPVSPAQTIEFTESPLIFTIKGTTPGSYPITYQANGSKEVIQIGMVLVKED